MPVRGGHEIDDAHWLGSPGAGNEGFCPGGRDHSGWRGGTWSVSPEDHVAQARTGRGLCASGSYQLAKQNRSVGAGNSSEKSERLECNQIDGGATAEGGLHGKDLDEQDVVARRVGSEYGIRGRFCEVAGRSPAQTHGKQCGTNPSPPRAWAEPCDEVAVRGQAFGRQLLRFQEPIKPCLLQTVNPTYVGRVASYRLLTSAKVRLGGCEVRIGPHWNASTGRGHCCGS